MLVLKSTRFVRNFMLYPCGLAFYKATTKKYTFTKPNVAWPAHITYRQTWAGNRKDGETTGGKRLSFILRTLTTAADN